MKEHILEFQVKLFFISINIKLQIKAIRPQYLLFIQMIQIMTQPPRCNRWSLFDELLHIS